MWVVDGLSVGRHRRTLVTPTGADQPGLGVQLGRFGRGPDFGLVPEPPVVRSVHQESFSTSARNDGERLADLRGLDQERVMALVAGHVDVLGGHAVGDQLIPQGVLEVIGIEDVRVDRHGQRRHPDPLERGGDAATAETDVVQVHRPVQHAGSCWRRTDEPASSRGAPGRSRRRTDSRDRTSRSARSWPGRTGRRTRPRCGSGSHRSRGPAGALGGARRRRRRRSSRPHAISDPCGWRCVRPSSRRSAAGLAAVAVARAATLRSRSG